MEENVEVNEQTEQVPVDVKADEKVKKTALKFSSEQQDLVNNLIKEKYTEAYIKAEAKYKTQFDTLRAELEAVKKGVDNKSGKPEQKLEEPEEFRQLKDKLAESERLLEMNRLNFEMTTEKQKALQSELEAERQARVQEKKLNTLLNSAQKQGFFDPNLVVKLVGDLVKPTEDGGFKVFNEAGQERWNEFMKPMSIDEFMAEYANTHSFLVKGTNTSGSGAREGKIHSARKWTRSEIAKLKPADYDKYRVEIHKAAKEGRIVDG